METLSTYEAASDQLLNKEKSNYMIPSYTPSDITDRIKEITGFIQKESPFHILVVHCILGGKELSITQNWWLSWLKRLVVGTLEF